jgi:hypothetical protein
MKRQALWLLILLVGQAHAEQGCSPGFFPGGAAPNGPTCVPIPGYGTTNNTTSGATKSGAAAQPSWSNRYGAIAIDDSASEGGIGTSEKMSSQSTAKSAALASCRATGGGTGCKLKAIYKNGCGVIAWGDAHYSTAVGPSAEDASAAAIKDCSVHTSNCKVFYSACSLPERRWVDPR